MVTLFIKEDIQKEGPSSECVITDLKNLLIAGEYCSNGKTRESIAEKGKYSLSLQEKYT